MKWNTNIYKRIYKCDKRILLLLSHHKSLHIADKYILLYYKYKYKTYSIILRNINKKEY